jgi:hypothetical protein
MNNHLSEETDRCIRQELDQLAEKHLPAELFENYRREKVFMVRNVRIALITGITAENERYEYEKRMILSWCNDQKEKAIYDEYVKVMQTQNLTPHSFKAFRTGDRFEHIKEIQRAGLAPGAAVRFIPTGTLARVAKIDEDGNVTLEDESGQQLVTAVSPFRVRKCD